MDKESFIEFAQESFYYLDNVTKNLTDELLDWKSCPEANSVRNILGHLLVEWYGALPKLLSGETVLKDEDTSVLQERLAAHGYVGVDGRSLEEIRVDLTKGKQYLFNEFAKLSDDDLMREVDWFRGKQPIGNYLMVFLKEIFHHEGQIAAIIGLHKRMKE